METPEPAESLDILDRVMLDMPSNASSKNNASPAVGTVYQHKLELAALLNSAFSI